MDDDLNPAAARLAAARAQQAQPGTKPGAATVLRAARAEAALDVLAKAGPGASAKARAAEDDDLVRLASEIAGDLEAVPAAPAPTPSPPPEKSPGGPPGALAAPSAPAGEGGEPSNAPFLRGLLARLKGD